PEDALGQDHAPPAARDRPRRGDHAGRLDAREPGDPRAAERGRLTRPSGGRRVILRPPERWMSGRNRTPGKRVGVTSPSGVRIPLSPPEQQAPAFAGVLVCTEDLSKPAPCLALRGC